VPQDAGFFMPFSRQSHPDRTAALERNIEWGRKLGLLPNDRAAKLFTFSGVAEFGTYFCTEPADDIDLVTNCMTYFFIFDDFFDTPSGQPADAAVSAALEMAELLGRPVSAPRAGAARIVTAFAELWGRMAKSRTEVWCRRAAGSWLDYIHSNIAEEADRRNGDESSLEDYLEVRKLSIGVVPTLHLLEAAGGFEVPPLAWHSSHMRAIRRIATEHMIFTNDIMGLEKDEARGESNLVHLIMKDQDCSRESAIAHVITTANERVRYFTMLYDGIAEFCDRMGLSRHERVAVHRHADNARDMITGDFYAHCDIDRYGDAGVARLSPDRPGLLGQGTGVAPV
jgi:hypothetical protein